jgi:hypothetical protein
MLLPNDPADWLCFAARIKWTLLCLLLSSIAVFVVFYLRHLRRRSFLLVLSGIATLVLLIAVVRAGSGTEMLLTLLGSEDDSIAEQAYLKLKNEAQTSWLISRINDRKEDSHVRFYLARMLPSVAQAHESRDDIIRRVSPDPITPGFFGVNAFNEDAKTIPPPLTTRAVVLRYWPNGTDN